MKKSILTICALLIAVFALWKCSSPQHAKVSYVKLGSLPADVLPCCTVNQDSFKNWFANGQVTAGGMVTPANSVTFPHDSNCNFYRWSERMFLWTTSPLKGSTVMASPTFYYVTPADSAGHRTLLQNVFNKPLQMTSHLIKVGPDGLPVVRDTKGRLFEIEPSTPQNAQVKDSAGKVVDVASIKQGAKGNFLFIDKTGKTIAHPRAIISHTNTRSPIVRRFMVSNKKFVFLDASGNQVESEEGQATGDVLMSQGGSLVYYLTEVNDVYAYYLTMRSLLGAPKTNFPTTAKERDLICAFARGHCTKLLDSNALAIEIKSSWVEASTLADTTGAGYITTNAYIQLYNTTDSTKWIPSGHKVVKMAMVGMHIVGSVAGHPEMVWATFEHQNNTPDTAYAYVDKNNKVQHVPQSTGSGWLFSNNAADKIHNVAHMGSFIGPKENHMVGDTITAYQGYKISPSNTLRTQPWGSAADSVTNGEDGSSARSNSEILSINNSILGMLSANDVRNNYIFIGATWTDGGAAPNRASYGADTTNGVAIGTSVLANSTMETYMQTASTSCFFCHSSHQTNPPTPPTLSPDVLSHIFAEIQPLVFKAHVKPKPSKK